MTREYTIDALLQQKLQLQRHLPSLLERCQSDAERATITGAYARAAEQWSEATNRVLRTNRPGLDALVQDLTSLNDEISGMIERADELGALLGKITTGITIGTKILMLIKP